MLIFLDLGHFGDWVDFELELFHRHRLCVCMSSPPVPSPRHKSTKIHNKPTLFVLFVILVIISINMKYLSSTEEGHGVVGQKSGCVGLNKLVAAL